MKFNNIGLPILSKILCLPQTRPTHSKSHLPPKKYGRIREIFLCPRHDKGRGIKCYPCPYIHTSVRLSKRRPLSKSNTFDQNFMKLGSHWSDFIWPFLPPYMGVIPNPKMAFIFPISCILVLIFPIFMKYFPKCSGRSSFPKSQVKSLHLLSSMMSSSSSILVLIAPCFQQLWPFVYENSTF